MGKNGVYCLCFIPMVYIFVNAKIKWLLQNLLNGSDCRTPERVAGDLSYRG